MKIKKAPPIKGDSLKEKKKISKKETVLRIRKEVDSGEKGLLKKKDIANNGTQLIQQRNLFCNCQNVRRDTLRFVLKCLTDVISYQNFLKLTPTQSSKLKKILLPFKTKVLRMADPKKRGYVMSQLTHQRGSGIFTGLMAAIAPIIVSLISRLLNKKKRK